VFRNSCLVILLALVTIIAVGCSVVSNPATPNAALPNPPASGPPAPSPLSITSSALPVATVGSGYSTMLQASGGITPYSWSATGLPAGLALSRSDGQISGTPSAAGSYMVTVSVSDSQTRPGTATRTLSLRVASVAPPPLSITTDSLPGGTAGSSYNAVLEASGGISPYGWSASGLPAGLALSTNTGQISGTPSTAGSYTVSASVRDSESSPAAASKTLSLNVASAAVLPLSITTTSLAAGTAGSSYSTALQASGGVTPYSWTVTGLPAGLSLNGGTGQIVGTPSTAGLTL